MEAVGVTVELMTGLLPHMADQYYELNAYNYGLVKVLTSETPAKVVIEIKDGEGNVLNTVELPEE